jgi:hypothetical protein
MRIAALVLLMLAPALAAQQPSQVTVNLAEYDALRTASEAPSATVIDSILLGGSFRDLTINFSGRTTGKRPLVKALEQMNEVTIYNCKGDGIISRSAKGTFDLIPLAPQFDVTCDLRISGSDRVQLRASSAVLAVRAAVTDGELVGGEEADSGARDYTLVRHVAAGPGETIAATATGRYRITLLPDATRFRYAIDVHNPNRTTSTLELRLQSNEHLQQIDSAAPYEVREGIYVFSIPPGDSTITMTGELRGTSFVAPVKASLQYLVLESHPLLRPVVSTPGKRISVGETGVTPQYRGALAFETGTARIAWNVTRLEALHAISYAVNDTRHNLFIPIDGPVLGETNYALRNEGAAELLLPPEPEPTYVSFDDEPVLMTKNAAGQLAVPLSPGEQNVLVQHRQPLRRVAGFAFGSVAVPTLDVPATNTSVTVAYPGQWIPLYEQFASRAKFWTPNASDVLLFLVLAIWIERLLSWAGLSIRTRFAIALFMALASSIVTTFLVLTVILVLALTVAWIAARPTMRERLTFVVLFGGVVFVAFVIAISTNSAKNYETTTDVGRTSKVESVPTDTAGADTGPDDLPTTAAPPPIVYQGLPAKFTLPSGERVSFFNQELLRTDRKQAVFLVAVSLVMTTAIGLLLGLIALILLWGNRAKFVALRALMPWERQPPPEPIAET